MLTAGSFLSLSWGAATGLWGLVPSSWQKAKQRLTRSKRRRPGVLYLTFDDGPSDVTPALLDLLARYGVTATFFVVGDFVRQRPQVIRRMAAEGHAIGFHSAHHHSAYCMTPGQTRADFAQGLEALAALGIVPVLYRPPWGAVNGTSLAELRARRLTPVLWDGMAQDWRANLTPGEIARRLANQTWPGAVLCLHDGRGAPGAPERTLQALALQLPRWLAAGYRFERVGTNG